MKYAKQSSWWLWNLIHELNGVKENGESAYENLNKILRRDYALQEQESKHQALSN